jgi:hypothetical protein
MQLIDNFGFTFTWNTMFVLAMGACILLFILKNLLRKESATV